MVAARSIQQHTPEWHEFRSEHYTATDAAIIAGETGSVVELWAQKRGLVEPPTFDQATRELMDEGLAIQPYLLDFYARRTGRKVRNINTVRVAKDWPLAACSPDGEVVGEPVGLEAKMSTAGKWRTDADPVPGDVFAQVQWQMYVAGWQRVDVVALLFGRPKVIEVPRDDTYIDDLRWAVRQFHGWVESGERPPLDGSENARRVLSAMHPRNDGTLLDAPPDVVALIRDIAAAKAEVKGSEQLIGSMENALRALIGDADGFEGEWGKATWKRNADSTRVNWPAVAAAYRKWIEDDLEAHKGIGLGDREELDAIQSIHTETVEGARVLRLSVKEPA